MQIGHAPFIGRLHGLEAVILGRNNVILEDDVDAGESNPAEKDGSQSRQRGLQGGAEGQKLHPATAADVNLPFRENVMQPRPDPLDDRMKGCCAVFGRQA